MQFQNQLLFRDLAEIDKKEFLLEFLFHKFQETKQDDFNSVTAKCLPNPGFKNMPKKGCLGTEKLWNLYRTPKVRLRVVCPGPNPGPACGPENRGIQKMEIQFLLVENNSMLMSFGKKLVTV